MAYMLVEAHGQVRVADVTERHDCGAGQAKVKLMFTQPEYVDPWGRVTGETVTEIERMVPVEWIHEDDQAVIL